MNSWIDFDGFYKKLDESGYIFVSVNGIWIQEHRWIVSLFIGRNLKKEEVVHHNDENKKNNLIENLILFPNQERHSHFHRQLKQFSYTNPRKLEILQLKKNMEEERNNNLKQEVIC